MTPPLLKICGLTGIADLRVAREAGADFLGVVIESISPRSVSVEVAAQLSRLAPRQVVAVSLSQDSHLLRRLIREMRPRALQLHGPRAPLLVGEFAGQCPVWVAVGLPPAGEDAEAALAEALRRVQEAAIAGAELIVLDTSVKGRSGGTGLTSDWDLAAVVVAQSPLPVLLAGGIGADNAAAALAKVQPAGLDASSRLEASPGRKDAGLVRELGRIVKQQPTEG